MAKKKKESYFWTSYSDLMTSLFFIMLVLFVLVIALLHQRLVATKTELDEIKKVEESTKNLSKDYFEYKKEYKKYVLKISVNYPAGQSDINFLPLETKEKLKEAGLEVKNFLLKNKEHQYILIIEGQASKFRYDDCIPDEYGNYRLSYRRALGLIQYWATDCNIKFGENCEIQIAGSGDGILPIPSSIREEEERKNQRFLIHILPKNIINDAADEMQ